MNKEQLNKIDEEFWEKASHTIKLIPTSQRELFKVEMIPLIQSLLQEAYELGRRDERGTIIEFLKENIEPFDIREHCADCLQKLENRGRYRDIKSEVIDKIKSLQTNKE